MPKRTNAFQNLFLLIYQKMNGNGNVTESKFLQDSAAKQNREVDIVVEVKRDGKEYVVGIECTGKELKPNKKKGKKSGDRKATVEWVERMWGKHQTLPTDKLVLVSQSGFTKSALRKAQYFEIQTISLAEAHTADWASIVNKEHSLYLERFDVSYVVRFIVKANDGSLEPWGVEVGDVVADAEGKPILEVGDFATKVMNDPQVRRAIFGLRDKGGGDHYVLAYDLPAGSGHLSKSGEKLEIVKVYMEISVSVVKTEVSLQHGLLDQTLVSYGEGGKAGQRIFLSVFENKGQPISSVVRWPETNEIGVGSPPPSNSE